MYDIKLKNVRKGIKFGAIFLFAGLLFFVVFLAIYISTNNKVNSMDSSVTSTSVDVRTSTDSDGGITYSPVYTYEVDGQTYTCGSNSSSSIYPGTDNGTVYYDSKNPSDCITEYSKSSANTILYFIIIPVIFIIVGGISIIKVIKRIGKIKALNQTGKLVKNLPYRLENTNMTVNDVRIQRPVVDYILPNGASVTLYGDPRHDLKTYDADGMVDLIIDEANPENYFIDFEINRLTGNTPEDYYQPTPSTFNNNANMSNQPTNGQTVFTYNYNQQPTNNQNQYQNNYGQPTINQQYQTYGQPANNQYQTYGQQTNNQYQTNYGQSTNTQYQNNYGQPTNNQNYYSNNNQNNNF